ncbi:MAG: hypothetical protein ACRCT7_10845 [Shewanella sp.]
MNGNKLLLLVMLSSATFASTEVYKCADGKYQDAPCNENSSPVDLSGIGNIIKTSDSISHPIAHTDTAADKQSEITRYIAKQQTSREIIKLENDRKQVIAMRDKRLRALRESRQYASNNLAGATWEQSLAQEQLAVTQAAETQVASIDRQIELLKAKKN